MSKLNVKIIEYTPNPEKVIAMAGKLCYSPSNINDLQDNLTEENARKFVNMLMSLGHESPLEHVSFTFAIEGVSRALSHQLVRHRIASYSQQSQRYVDGNNFDFVIPKTWEENTSNEWIQQYKKETMRLYNELIKLGIPKEDARYILPNACETKIIVTMNARSLMNFFKHRCCNRAQWEIRQLANEMLKQCKEIAPTLFKYAGASCVMNGTCPEDKMSCGRVATTEEVLKLAKENNLKIVKGD